MINGKLLNQWLCFVLFVACSPGSKAFNINPLNRSAVVNPGGSNFLDLVTEPVHEIITRKAREMYWVKCRDEGADEEICPKAPKHPRTIYDSLIRGNWWSDDPNQFLYKGRQVLWVGNMKDAARRSKSKKYVIDGKYKMHYRSHYGDMQFIHSMASNDGDEGEKTLRGIYMWAEYLYKIAIDEVGPETLFKDIHVNGFSDYFERQANWELKWIMQPRYLLRSKQNDFADHALGALLHMIQDSYSAAHVERSAQSTANCSSGVIKRFHSYSRQSTSKHGIADTLQAFKELKSPIGPVEASAALIRFAKYKLDWKTVVFPYLTKNIFCFEGQLMDAGPGDY